MKLGVINVKIAAIAGFLMVIIVGFIVWYSTRQAEILEEGDGLGSELYENAQNPLGEKLPETNPFDATTNPFKKVETNPYKSNYKNPF